MNVDKLVDNATLLDGSLKENFGRLTNDEETSATSNVVNPAARFRFLK